MLLYAVCHRGHKDIVELLISKGADVNRGIYLPIIDALENKNTEIVKILLECNGIDLDKEDVCRFFMVEIIEKMNYLVFFETRTMEKVQRRILVI